jgi:C4-dicarboxylate-binding protein DctP
MMQATNRNFREESSMISTSRRLIVAGFMVGGLLAALPASAQQFTMKLSMPTINDVTYEYFKRMKAGIEQRSGGKIKVDIYPSNQLGQLPAVVEGVALGTIEAAASANGFWVSLEPRFQVLDAPGLFDDLIHGNKMLNDPGIRARLATWGVDKGVEILTPGLYSPLMILSHKAIRTIADFQGQKIRTQGGAPIQVEPLKKTGAIPVSLPLGEALPAMQNKTIDGMVGAAAPYVAFKYYDIAKPMTFLPATLFAAPVVANRQFMKSLGPELEKIVREESAKAEVLFSDYNIADIKTKEEIWRKNGGEVITMSPEESKRYVDMVTPVAASILAANPKVKDDYEALLAAAKKYRQ